ncbi:MAG: TetR/AcrR family transcriptional regulator C-terminal domain-containing protein [Butyricicoccus sp.]
MKQEELSQKRKEQMAESLKKLMKQKSLQKITIQEIADDCGMNRYTFYYHFKDIYDLLSWVFHEEALSLIRKSDNCLTWQEGFLLFLRSIRENREVFQCALNSLGQDALRAMFYQEVSHLMQLFLTDVGGKYQVSQAFRGFLGDFYIAALSGIIVEWIRRDLDLSEDDMMRYLRLTLDGQIDAILGRAEQEGA